MKCMKCDIDLEEKYIEESHDVPCYLFPGNRQGQKNQADKFGRHWLCNNCHRTYEAQLRLILIKSSQAFAMNYFKEEKDDTKKVTD